MADRVLRAVITVDAVGAIAGMDAVADASDGTAKKLSGDMEDSSSKIGSIFDKLGSTVGNYSSTAGNAISNVGTKFDDAAKKGNTFTTALGEAGKAVALGVAAGAVAVVAAGIDMAEKYQTITNKIAANEDISQKAATAVGKAFLSTAFTVTFSGSQIATAFASVAGQAEQINGKALTAGQSLSLMKSAMDLAEASGTDLNTATQAVTNTLQAFGLKISDSPLVADILYNASNKTGVSVSTLSGELDKIKTKTGDLTPPIGQLGGLLVDLAAHGETGRAALTVLSTAFTGLITPTGNLTAAQKAVKAAQDAAGVSFQTSSGNLVSMQSIIKQVGPLIAGMGNAQAVAELQSLGFGSASSKLVGVIRGGTGVFDADTASVTKAGSAHKAAEVATSGLKDSFKKLKSGVGDLVTEVGEKFLPIITGVINFLTNHKGIFAALGIAIAALGLTFMGFWVGQTIAAMSFWTAATGGIVILVAALAIGILWMTKHWKEVWDGIKDVASDAWKVIDVNVVEPIKSSFEAVWHFIDANFIEPLRNAFSAVVDFIKAHWELLAEILLAPVAPALALFLRFHTQIIGFFTDIVDWVRNHFGEVGTDIKKVWTTVSTDASNLIKDVVGFFTELPAKIVTALGDLGTDFENLGKNLLSDLINGIKSAPSAIMDAIKSLIPGGGVVKDVTSFLHLAGGGIVTTPTFALIGESGPEAVVPLNAVGGAGAMSGSGVSPLPSGSSGGAGQVINYSPVYNISGAPDATSLALWKQLTEAHDEELVRTLSAT